MGTMSWPPSGNCTPVLTTARRESSRLAGPKPLPTARTSRGLSLAIVVIAAGSPRGSWPGIATTLAPAASAVAVAAIATALFCLDTRTSEWDSGLGSDMSASPAGLEVTLAPGISAESSLVFSPTTSTLRGCRSLISRRAARVLAELAGWGRLTGLPRKETMLVAVADNGEDSSNGACAFSASGTAAATDAGSSLATTTLDAHPSSEFATSAASSAGEPERTDVADIGWRLQAEGPAADGCR